MEASKRAQEAKVKDQMKQEKQFEFERDQKAKVAATQAAAEKRRSEMEVRDA